MLQHIVIDRTTGEIKLQARDGTQYTLEEIEDAERRARDGDPAAAALLDSLALDHTGVIDMEQMLHDCPDCRAAMARGERPTMIGAEEIEAMRREMQREARRPPLRWRTRKQRRGH